MQVTAGNFVKLESNYIGLADGSSRIEGVATMTKNFATDNQTGAMEECLYVPKQFYGTADIKISGGTVDQTDVGFYFNLTSIQEIDYATKNAVLGQFRLEKPKKG